MLLCDALGRRKLFVMPDINHRVAIHAAPERVYLALATAAGIRQWWTRDATLASEVGGAGEFAFNGRKTLTKVRIEELTPPQRVVWKTIASNAPGGWDGTVIAFTLQAQGDDTVLLCAHTGFLCANEGYEKVTKGWAHYLHSLKLYLETGVGDPR